jgi:hypothetical protein
MKKRVLAGVLALLMGVSMAACGEEKKPEPSETKEEASLDAQIEDVEEEEEVPEETIAEEPEVVSDTAPAGMSLNNLSGTWVDETVAEYRPFACMIENGEGDLPFWGLSKADIVYEAPAESDITRIMGLWQDWPSIEKIGTVRSARTYFAAWSKEYDALFGHFGCSIFAIPMLRTIDDMDGIAVDMGSATDEAKQKQSPYLEDTMFFRDPNRSSVHSVYTSGELIQKTIDKYPDHYRQMAKDGIGERFDFAPASTPVDLTADPNVKDCVVVAPGGYTDKKPYYIYDEATKLYKRYQKGAPHMDEQYGEQLTAKNIIIQNVDWELYKGVDADYDSHNYKNIKTTGNGDGWFITEGKAIPIMWSKPGADTDGEPTVFLDMSGKGIQVNPGTTWINVVLNENKEKTGVYESEAAFSAN